MPVLKEFLTDLRENGYSETIVDQRGDPPATDQGAAQGYSFSLEPRQLVHAERLASLGQLAAEIVHDINNPLNSILMNAELGLLSLRSNDDPEKLTHIFHTIVGEAKRGGGITQRLLQFARTDSYEPDPGTATDLNAVVERARRLSRGVLRRSRVTLEFEPVPTLPPLHLQEIALEQALTALFRNAAEAGASQINVTLEKNAATVVMTIADNGSGIARHDLSRVFDPFFTTHKEQGAMGLSLSLVRHVVSAHSGTLSVQSLPDVGTEFIIQLPLPSEQSTADRAGSDSDGVQGESL